MELIVLTALLTAGSAAPPDLPACPSTEERPDVKMLVQRTDRLLHGTSSVGTMVMSIKTPQWSRKLKFKTWTRGDDYALMRVLEGGPHETGMMTLKREKQLWNWLPQAGRVMKLPSSMMGDAWMGSDFTNDDLVKGSSWIDDFDATVTGVIQQDGHEAWQIALKPKAKAVVVWGRIDLIVERKTCQPLAERFFDEDAKLVRTMLLSDYAQFGWRLFPRKMTIVPVEPGRETSISHESMEFDVDLPDSTFSLDRLRQGK